MKVETEIDRTVREKIDKLSSKKGGRKELAQACGVTAQTVSNIICGVHRPRLPLLVAIADHYGVTVDYLLGRKDAPAKTAATHSAEARGYAAGLRLAADAIADLSDRLHDRADKTQPRKN